MLCCLLNMHNAPYTQCYTHIYSPTLYTVDYYYYCLHIVCVLFDLKQYNIHANKYLSLSIGISDHH